MIDARINVALPSHPKTKKLIKKAGAESAWRLICLFLWAAQNKPDGDLSGMIAEDIELAVDWTGEDGAFVGALITSGFLDGSDEEGYSIHDWSEHNPWAAGAEKRSEKARFNALCKHVGRTEAANRMPEYAASLPVAKVSPATSMHVAETSTAPSPSPSPSPKEEAKEPRAPRFDAQAHLVELKVDPVIAADWLAHRKAKKATVTLTVIDGIKSEAAKARIALSDALALCCQRGWTGFKAEWVAEAIGNQPAKTQYQINQEATTRALFGSMLPSSRNESMKTIEGEVMP